MLDVKSMLSKILDRLSATGTIYVRSWTATSSSAYGTTVTDLVTIPPGTYIIAITTPPASADFGVGFLGAYVTVPAGGGTFTQLIQISQSAQVRPFISQSASVTFSYIERGSMRIIRIR